MNAPNAGYTFDDHNVRDDDAYAQLKYQLTLDWLKKLDQVVEGTILNVGAGTGLFSFMAQDAGYSSFNLEPDSSAAQRAIARLGASAVAVSSLEDFEPPEAYSAVVMHDVLEHISDDFQAVSSLWKLCRVQGAPLVVSVPAWNSLFGFHDEQLGHYRRYSPSALRRVLATHFEILRLRHVGLLGIPAALYYSKMRRKPYPVGEGGFAERIFRTSCRIERIVPPPIGTSVMILAKPKQDVLP